MTLVVLGGGAAGDALASALSHEGHPALTCSKDSGETLVAAELVAELRQAGDIAAIIILVGSEPSDRPAHELAAIDDLGWAALFERPLKRGRVRLQAAGELLQAGGRVIFVSTSGGMAGVAGQVAACAVEEGARALAKSVALAWQPGGRTICFAAFDRSALSTAKGRSDTLVPTIHMLLSAPAALTGASIIADGATLLAP